MIDFHSHLLPGIDDGSDSADTSLQMLGMWRGQRIDLICATPHFYADRNTPARFLRDRAAAYAELSAAMAEYGEGYFPPLRLGAEVHFFDGISTAEELDGLCLQGTRLLLLEMPFRRWSERMLREVEAIRRRGIQPVAAHIERYLSIQSRQLMREFMALDVYIQCNAEFFLDRRTARKALHMLKNGQIQFLGSDAHNMSSRRPNLGPALELIEQKLGAAAIDRLWDYAGLVTSPGGF